VKLADFGLARLVGGIEAGTRLTGVNQVMGTPAYMAPEQISNPQGVDKRSDVYALGVILYECLTDQLPQGHFDPPSAKLEDTRLDDIVFKAMARDPDKRYPTARAMRDDIVKLQEKPYRTAVLIDLALFYAWSLLFVVLIISLVLRMDLSSLWWLLLWSFARAWDERYWSFPRSRRLARAQGFVACLSINLVGPLFGFDRPEILAELTETWPIVCIGLQVFASSCQIGWRVGTRLPGRARQGWLAFATAILLATGIGVCLRVLQAHWHDFERWRAFIVSVVVWAYVVCANRLELQKVRELA
jgi:hypothetical protein